MENFNSPQSLFNGLHLNKRKSFRALGMTVRNHFDAGHGSDTAEELIEVGLRGIEGQIANIKARACHFNRLGFTLWAGRPWGGWLLGPGRGFLRPCGFWGRAIRAGRVSLLLRFSCEEGRDFLPEALLLRCGGGMGALFAPGTRTAASAARSTGTGWCVVL